MSKTWYVESYAADGLSAEGSENYESYNDAFDAVKKIVADGKIARFLAPTTASREELESFHKLGSVQRI
jgi:hypothetical protein